MTCWRKYAWIVLLCGMTGCYRPTTMPMDSLFRPWLSSERSSSALSSRKQWPVVAVLDESQVVFHLLHSNPRLQTLRQRLRVVQAGVGAVAPVMNPELRIMGISSGVLANNQLDPLGIRLRWEPPVPTAYGAKTDLALALAQVEEHNVWAETYRLLHQVRNLYAQLLSTELLLEQQQQRLQRSQQMWLWEQARQQSSRSSVLQVASRRLAYLQQQAVLQQWQFTRNMQRIQLQTWLGIRGPCRVQPATLLSTSVAEIPALTVLLKQALIRSPELHGIQSQYRAAHAQLWLEKIKRIPWFSYVQFSYEFGQSFWPDGFTLGMGLTLPIFDWNTGKIHQQQLQIQNLQSQAQIQIASIVQRVHAAYQQWQSAGHLVKQHHKQAEQAVRHSQQQMARMATQPGVDPLQVWRVQEQILQWQQQQVSRTLQWYQARHDLDLATSAPVWQNLGVKLPQKTGGTRIP